jgi:ketosteroid isomerase-like protein
MRSAIMILVGLPAFAGAALGAEPVKAGPAEAGAVRDELAKAQEEAGQLIEADRQFDLDTLARGADGWASWFAEDGVMGREGKPPVVGREAIREHMGKAFASPGFSLRWQPVAAQMQIPGQLGVTRGRSQMRSRDVSGRELTRAGAYLSVWRRHPDGSWKVVYDTGALDLEPIPAAAPVRSAAPDPGAPPPPELERRVRELLAGQRRIEAIKLVRERTGWTLLRAKEYVDGLGAEP